MLYYISLLKEQKDTLSVRQRTWYLSPRKIVSYIYTVCSNLCNYTSRCPVAYMRTMIK